jgi:hypothetical protein
MKIEALGADALWYYYKRGYHVILRNGIYFRQILRPVMSHVYFFRAVPLLQEYAEANRTDSDMPPGFRERLEACPLTPRDLLHLDYAICMGFAEMQGADPVALASKPVMDWPGFGALSGTFIAADALLLSGDTTFVEDQEEVEDLTDQDPKPPFDL